MDHTRNDGFLKDATLDQFFSRPIRIYETQWSPGTSLFARFDPWSLFWENGANSDKIRNYYLLKCTMHVKLLINGNAFYYGRLLASYEPLVARDNTSYNILTRKNAYINQDLVRSSQRMHFFVNPTDSTGGSFELPFFWDKNALIIPNNEWNQMGEIVLQSINDLNHANGGTEPVTISVMAWAENVSFSIPTCNEAEMGEPEMADEHNVNVISRPASAVARVARSLTNVPWIGPFARATEIGAGAVAAIAKIFGYSSPVELDFGNMVPATRPSFAVVDAKFATNKLSLDSKQEVTIDPTTTGIDAMDELPIASIAGRESYFTTFDWNMTDGIDTCLFQTRVDPALYRTSAGEYHFPACAAAMVPFEMWRGTMRFRFQIVSSAYHKGRIRLVYEPRSFNTPTPEFNLHYTSIHDISTDKDFTIDVGWAQEEPYRQKTAISDVNFTENQFFLLPTIPRGNGVLGVYVMNELTVPGTVTANIQINCFVSMLDDFEVALPGSDTCLYTFRNPGDPADPFPEMGEPEMAEEMVADNDCCDSPPTDPVAIDNMADTLIATPDTTKLFFGEVIGSFRQLLKRDCLAEAIFVPSPTETVMYELTRLSFPEYRGRLPDSLLTFSDSVVLSYANNDRWIPTSTTYLNYVSRMFLGWRGAIRWTFDTSGLRDKTGSDGVNSLSLLLSRAEFSDRKWGTTSLLGVAGGPTQNLLNVRLTEEEQACLHRGAYIGNTHVNPIQSIEVPFYKNRRFLTTMEDRPYNTRIADPSWRLQMVIPQDKGGEDPSYLRCFCSAGEDFNLFFFNGLPPVFRFFNIPNDAGA